MTAKKTTTKTKTASKQTASKGLPNEITIHGESKVIPKPRRRQTILGYRESDGSLKWFTEAAWKLIPAIKVRDKTGVQVTAQRQGFVQIDPSQFGTPERLEK